MNKNTTPNNSKTSSLLEPILNKTTNILEFKNITKTYPGVVALDNVSFNVRNNKILSLVGENGAGKSTLLKIISGVIAYNNHQGQVLYNGKEAKFLSVHESEKAGIAIIHQELSISPFLPVYENVFMGHFKSSFGILNWSKMIKEAKYWLDLVGLTDINLYEQAGQLSIAKQQLIEIAKALSTKAKLLILDEPTSSLNDRESYQLLDLLKNLRDTQGITCIFVSHKLKEVAYVADDIAVIRDGKFISQYNAQTQKIDEQQLIKDIVGRELSAKFPPKPQNRVIGKEVLRVENICVEHPRFVDVNIVENGYFNVKQGELVGLSGLVGSGRSEMAMAVFGRQSGKMISGDIYLYNKKIQIRSPLSAIKNKIMYATEDRKNTGLIQIFSIDYNIALASLHLYSKGGVLSNMRLLKNSFDKKEELQIKVPDLQNPVESLSGGNQQKVIVAKALTTEFDVLIIDEPTKGIDVGSKYEIYRILLDLAAKGKAIIVISSELEELLGITDRIFVMEQGWVKGEIKTADTTQEKIFKISQKQVKPKGN